MTFIEKLIKFIDDREMVLEDNNKEILNLLTERIDRDRSKNISDLNWNVAQLTLLKELKNFVEKEKVIEPIDDKVVSVVFLLGEPRKDGKRYIKDKDISEEIVSLTYNYGKDNFEISYNKEIAYEGEANNSWTYDVIKTQILLTNSVKQISEEVMRWIIFRNHDTKIKKKYIYDFLNEFRTWLFINRIPDALKDQSYYEKLKEITK